MTAPDLSDDANQSSDSNSTSRRRFLAGAAVAGSALTLSSTAIAMKSSASVTFDDQTTGGTSISVASATLPEGGFIAIHDGRLLDGKALESVIGVSDSLDAGTHENVDVELFDVKGAEFDSKMLEDDGTLIAMPHVDSNDNGEYEFVSSGGQKDGPYTKDEKAVIDDAKVSVDAKPMASVTFDDGTSDGTMVSVDSVTLSDGGFVAIHDSSLLDGDVFDSVIGVSKYLESGTHEDVSVSLFNVPGGEFDMEMLKDDATLIAMPHLDSNGNEEYDFVECEGKYDGPYTMDGKAVVDDAMITVEMESKPTADVCFRDQKSDGESVWVNSATLSDGGFVTIHDASLLDGEVFDSVIGVSDALAAGTHEDIEISLYEGVPGGDYEMSMLEEDTTLIAMPHVDSDRNGTYDFLTSEGDTDGPYTMDGEAVVDDAMISLSGGC
ncbi:twin-arginine translocation signal domain-containing protein [Haladaptatus sp. CMAA 1911]|uniref:twin-arginine translocation signal domain-containing protein n=1 Tax=unclassified Haladaptatus TaxID=2622732 RepID=UPI003754DD89